LLDTRGVLETLIAKNRAFFVRLGLKYLQDAALVEDCLQEGYRRFLESPRTFADADEAERYLIRVLVNRFIDEYRRRRSYVQSTCPFDEDRHDGAAGGGGPEIRVIARQQVEKRGSLAARLARQLERLPPLQRELVYLVLLREPPMSLRQVSQLKKIPISTLHSRYRGALDRLRELCRELGEEWKKL
jgi:RNA polymerase sigma factor (sigma-70 family)